MLCLRTCAHMLNSLAYAHAARDGKDTEAVVPLCTPSWHDDVHMQTAVHCQICCKYMCVCIGIYIYIFYGHRDVVRASKRAALANLPPAYTPPATLVCFWLRSGTRLCEFGLLCNAYVFTYWTRFNAYFTYALQPPSLAHNTNFACAN